ncbi:MAG: pirin family protein [Sediminibacterium sp.]|nr:pirin family protein [Sediminibacterium sp.]
MKNTVLHKADTRGYADHGWLQSFHSFSFGDYYNSERMHFGALRVLNDDTFAASTGFGLHPHKDMEIITIMLEGDLEHQDNMGTSFIHKDDIQAISAGTGIRHSAYNKHKYKPLNLLQIWVMPSKKNITPQYNQISLKKDDRKNKLQQILSPNANDEGVWIHQNAWFYMGDLEKGVSVEYSVKIPENGLYVFVISGNLLINGQELSTRDGYGIWNTPTIKLDAIDDSVVLIMEVPMTI